ncbi:MAG: hypothetical protein AAF571_08660 [Verrucomicrobiota bacterium]
MTYHTSALQPQSPFKRADIWYALKWFPLMLFSFISLFVVWAWADQKGNEETSTLSWVMAEAAEKANNLSYTWTLAAIAMLVLVSARKGHYLLVLGLGSMAFYFRNHPGFALYFLGITGVLYPILHYGGRWKHKAFWGILVITTLLLPKGLYYFGYYRPELWNWISDIGLTGLLLRYAYYYYELRKGIIQKPGFFEHLSYLAFIPQITATVNFSPSAQWNNHGEYPKVYQRGWQLLGIAFGKIIGFKLLSEIEMDIWSPATGILNIWTGAILYYLKWYLWLSAHYDLTIALCRFLGADLAANFNYPLLAPSFIEQWRRWNIYNRKLLLKFFYFPFGGKEHHRFRNVFIVFAASAVLLHSGWFATKWPTVDASYLFAWLLFAGLQAIAVCLNMQARDRKGLNGHHWPRGWAYVKGLVVTQITMVWLHLLIMGTGAMPGDTQVPLLDRIATMARAFGLPV